VIYDTSHIFGETPRVAPDLAASIAALAGGMQTGCLMRRALVVQEGNIDETLHYIMDRDILLRLALRGIPYYVARPVILLREYPHAKSFAWNADRAKERLLIAHKIFDRPDLPPSVRALKRTAFASAHRFAWECYAKAGKNTLVFWHLLLDLLYAPAGGWLHRRRIVKLLARQRSSKGLYWLSKLMKKGERIASKPER
jgi:GT2 family glycosyltransferase